MKERVSGSLGHICIHRILHLLAQLSMSSLLKFIPQKTGQSYTFPAFYIYLFKTWVSSSFHLHNDFHLEENNLLDSSDYLGANNNLRASNNLGVNNNFYIQNSTFK